MHKYIKQISEYKIMYLKKKLVRVFAQVHKMNMFEAGVSRCLSIDLQNYSARVSEILHSR